MQTRKEKYEEAKIYLKERSIIVTKSKITIIYVYGRSSHNPIVVRNFV